MAYSTSYSNSLRGYNVNSNLQKRIESLRKRTKKFNAHSLSDDMFEGFEEDFKNMENDFVETFKTSMLDELQKVKKPKKKTVSIKKRRANSTKTKERKPTMNQFLTLDIGSNKATIDLSKVRKQGLLFEKSIFGKKPKIVIYYNDRPEVPEVNFELNSEDEARKVYDKINNKLEAWADASNSANITRLEKELVVMKEQKEAMLEEKEVLMDVFNSFKEMMQIMEDDNKTSSLVDTIEKL